MKNLRKVLLTALMLVIVIICFAQENENSLTVTITGISELKGEIAVGVYNDAESYEKGDYFTGEFVTADKETITHTFENIPEGVYAIAIYHDKNSNKIMDRNFMKIPKEGYAFSNNLFGTFGPPKFEKVKFEVKEDIQLEINIKY